MCIRDRVRIQRLVPFIDDFGLIRVRGRLTNSMVTRNHFPVLLPKHHHLVGLLIHHTHVWLGHAGPLQVQFQLAQNYWILSARQVIRTIIWKCLPCFRARPGPTNPLMGDLPIPRVNPAPPFYSSSMDYAGPFLVRAYAVRKAPIVKAYFHLLSH